jgi:TonB family protein
LRQYLALALLGFSLPWAQAQTPDIAGNTKADKAPPQCVRISEILVATPQPYTADQLAEAQHKAEQVRSAILRGDSFADLAKLNSQGPTAASGGDVGYFALGDLSPALEAPAFHMGIGDVSDVIRTKQGFVILKVTDQRPFPEIGSLKLFSCASVTPDVQSYLQTLTEKVRRNWYKSIPSSAQRKTGIVTIDFRIHQQGTITDAHVSSVATDPDLEEAALSAIQKVRGLRPIPEALNAKAFSLRFTFTYNPAGDKLQ